MKEGEYLLKNIIGAEAVSEFLNSVLIKNVNLSLATILKLGAINKYLLNPAS